MSRPIDSLLYREMSRREFLAVLALGVASVMGFSTIIHLFTGKSFHTQLNDSSSSGYGVSSYGGGKG